MKAVVCVVGVVYLDSDSNSCVHSVASIVPVAGDIRGVRKNMLFALSMSHCYRKTVPGSALDLYRANSDVDSRPCHYRKPEMVEWERNSQFFPKDPFELADIPEMDLCGKKSHSAEKLPPIELVDGVDNTVCCRTDAIYLEESEGALDTLVHTVSRWKNGFYWCHGAGVFLPPKVWTLTENEVYHHHFDCGQSQAANPTFAWILYCPQKHQRKPRLLSVGRFVRAPESRYIRHFQIGESRIVFYRMVAKKDCGDGVEMFRWVERT